MTKLAETIIDGIYEDSASLVVESVDQAIREKLVMKLVEHRKNLAKDFLGINEEHDLVEDAKDYMLGLISEGMDYATAVVRTSDTYDVPEYQLLDFLSENFTPEDTTSYTMVETLADIIERDLTTLVTFENGTSKMVSPKESSAILEVWLNLDSENRQRLEESLSDLVSFNKVTKFALNEYVSGIDPRYSTGNLKTERYSIPTSSGDAPAKAHLAAAHDAGWRFRRV